MKKDILYPHTGFTNDLLPKITDELEVLYRRMHEVLGINLQDPNSTDTPRRAAKALATEFFGGLNRDNLPKMTTFPNTEKMDEIVFVHIENFYSTCAHHFAPFFGEVWIGYVPDQSVLGLSKFARLVKFYSRRPQIQENLTIQIADFLEGLLKPKALGVVMKARHLCMNSRGVEAHGATTTSALRGSFLSDQAARAEFFELIKLSK